VRLVATARWLGLLVGPAIGSVLMLAAGPTGGILINVCFYVPLLLWLWKAPYGPKFAKEPRAASVPIRGFHEIFDTMRAVAKHRTIVAMTLLAGAASLFVGNAYQAQMPEFAENLGHGHGGPGYGMLLAADAAGALLAGIVLESRGLLQPSARKAFVLAMLWCLAIAGFAVSPNYPLAWTLLFIAGFVQLAFSAMAQAIVQIEAPAAIRGRVIGLYTMSSLGLRAFAGITVGILGSVIGVHWSLALSAMMLLVVIAALLAYTSRVQA
jgi:MFS family permease